MTIHSSAASPVLDQAAGAPDNSVQPAQRWNAVTCVAFRFLFGFFSLICLNVLSVVVLIAIYFSTGKISGRTGFMDFIWRDTVPWFARHVLRWRQDVTMAGRGDSAFDWLQLVLIMVLAASATVVWSVWDRRRANYARLQEWLRVAVRMSLAGAMIIYGTDKVFPLQFGTLGLVRLTTPIGQLDPEGMLWAFMAASTGYTIFSGLGEVTGAVLLIIPRLANLGAIVTIGVMTNVFALNVFYNVPVKIFSLLYLLMGIFLLAPELRRLADVLVFNRSVPPAIRPSLFRSPRLNSIASIAQVLIGGLFLAVCLHGTHKLYAARQQALLAKPPLYGIWIASDFVEVGNSPVLSAERRWHRLIFERAGGVSIESDSGEQHQVKLELDASRNIMKLSRPGAAAWNASLHFEQPSVSELVLDGKIDGSKIRAVLHRVDESKFPLSSVGIHWVQ